ncbi:MAG TPA: biotin/lipoyl-containing protein [Patescibacteria group bacterium]|nr:biotin/lipoyl-containing protein [Patescibacteria group bacterium]
MTDPLRPARTADERIADHAAIERLADDLLPALIAKLGATGLGEIEVGEDAWTVRIRRPADAPSSHARRVSDRASRSQPGHAGHGHLPGGFEGHRSARDSKAIGGSAGTSAGAAGASNGSAPGGADLDGGNGRGIDPPGGDSHRVVATSPAVGVFQPRPEVKPGSRVRNGDRLGAVDMLGIAQEVVAPADGILGASLVEAGQAVEYGQELIVIELAARTSDRSEA